MLRIVNYTKQKLFYGSNKRRIVKTLTFTGAEVIDIAFRRLTTLDSGTYTTYLGTDLNQGFDTIYIENRSTFKGSYCIETDSDDSITVDNSGNDSVKVVEAQGTPGSIIFEDNTPEINRIRVYLAGAGSVDIALTLE